VDERLIRLRDEVIARTNDPTFLHHDWYVDQHLTVVVRIARELLAHHPEADSATVEALAWLHDIGKVLHPPDVDRSPAEAARLLSVHGFDVGFADRVAEYVRILDAKTALDTAPVEVQIVSSADGCAPLVGPFMAIYWRDNPNLTVAALMAENRRKATVSWQRKIVLPEARAAFADRFQLLMEQTGQLPDRFLDPPAE